MATLGGRIVRITPDGVVTPFANDFNTSGSYFSDSFIDSSLSITFSADGTTLYASDNDGIWQFKSILSLAYSIGREITGLSDLRSLGVPYEGQDSAIAIMDTGIDALTPNFRGRVSEGYSVLTGGPGNDDPTPTTILNGHGTELASVVAQFVPEATLVPVNIVSPNFGDIDPGHPGRPPTASRSGRACSSSPGTRWCRTRCGPTSWTGSSPRRPASARSTRSTPSRPPSDAIRRSSWP